MGGGCNSKHYWLMELLLDLDHGLMLLWFADLMNVTEEVTIHRPNFSTLLSNAFIRGDLNDEGTRQECRNVGSINCNVFGYIH